MTNKAFKEIEKCLKNTYYRTSLATGDLMLKYYSRNSNGEVVCNNGAYAVRWLLRDIRKIMKENKDV